MKHLIKKLLREGLEGNEYFNLKTSAQDYDNLLAKNYDALPGKYKDYEASIEYMTMEEYIREVAKIQNTSYEEQFNYISKGKVDKIIENMSNGTKYYIGYLNYVDKSQEGRHRVVAASKLGLEKIPVLVISRDGDVEDSESFNETYNLNDTDEWIEFARLFPDNNISDEAIPRYINDRKYGVEMADGEWQFKGKRDYEYLPEVTWDKPVEPLSDIILDQLKKIPKSKIKDEADNCGIESTNLELGNLLSLVECLQDYVPDLFVYIQRLIYGVSKYMSDKLNRDLLEINEYGIRIEIGGGIARVYSEGGKDDILTHNFGFEGRDYFYDNLSSSVTLEWMKLYPHKS